VTGLKNGDFAVGSSDGVLLIFSQSDPMKLTSRDIVKVNTVEDSHNKIDNIGTKR
jgi:hypothetical protein